MAFVPSAFWLPSIRPKGKPPTFVPPVIYLGSLASSAMAAEGASAIVSCLLVAALAVDAAGHLDAVRGGKNPPPALFRTLKANEI